MIWFFQRAGAELRVVTRVDQLSGEYVIEVESPGRDRDIERYTDYDAFNQRIQRLHAELMESRWIQHGTPTIITDGWRGPTSHG